MLRALLKTMRPKQWTKNGFVFFALIFDAQLFQPVAFLRTLAGFALFCLISSAVYIQNDIADVEADRQHPTKRARPIASGALPLTAAWVAFYALTILSLGAGFLLSVSFGATLTLYLLSNVLYSRGLKHVAILDVMIIASGFVLRVHAGTTLIVVERFSPWLYIVTTLFALFVGFGKRRAELTLLEKGASAHRKVLDGYTLPLLDQFITIVSGATILAYALYTITAPNVAGNHAMLLTVPFVVYGIFRYLFIIQTTHDAGAPDEVALKDRPLQWTVLLWSLTVLLVFYFFK